MAGVFGRLPLLHPRPFPDPHEPHETKASGVLRPVVFGGNDGLGANLAFADADRLTTTLSESTDLLTDLAAYEDQMRTTAATVYHHAMAGLPIFEHLQACPSGKVAIRHGVPPGESPPPAASVL